MAISKIILGTVQLGLDYGINSSGKAPKEEALSILKEAREAGIGMLDTAHVYGNAIDIIGCYHEKGNKFSIISKFKIEGDSDFTEQFKSDLRALNVSKIDALLFHNFQDYYKNGETHLKKLLVLKEQQLLNKLGVSIYTNEEFEVAMCDKNIDLIQLPFNLLDNANLRGDILKKAKEQGKEIHVRSIFLQGLFFKQLDKVPAKLDPLKPYLAKLPKIAEDLGISVAELAFLYTLQHKGIDKILFGVDNLKQLQENIKIIHNLPSIDVVDKVNREIHLKETALLNPNNWKKKIILITQARMGSSRLPGKVMKTVNGQSLLETHLTRLRKSKKIDEFIVATTLSENDNVIADLAAKMNLKFFRGSENDVLDRYYQAALPYQPDIIVRVTSDCPLLDADVVDKVIDLAIEKNVDYCSNTMQPTFPNGQDVEVFKFSALEKAWKEATLSSEREHVTPYLWKNVDVKGGDKFKGFHFKGDENYSNLRMTVDEDSDFKVIEKLIQACGTDCNWKEYAQTMERDHLTDLNGHFNRNEGYKKSIANDGK
ncbi:MAG: aldo/keto reductase [Flavobacteriales bacterium]